MKAEKDKRTLRDTYKICIHFGASTWTYHSSGLRNKVFYGYEVTHLVLPCNEHFSASKSLLIEKQNRKQSQLESAHFASLRTS